MRFFELRPRIFRSPSDVDTLGRASVLRDGAAFRPASAPHPLLLENHFYQPFTHPSETPLHPHTAPHTPTELEQQLERARSEERSNCDVKESVAEGEKERGRRRSLHWEINVKSSKTKRIFSNGKLVSCRRSSNKTRASSVDRSGKGGEAGGETVRRGLSRTGVGRELVRPKLGSSAARGAAGSGDGADATGSSADTRSKTRHARYVEHEDQQGQHCLHYRRWWVPSIVFALSRGIGVFILYFASGANYEFNSAEIRMWDAKRNFA